MTEILIFGAVSIVIVIVLGIGILNVIRDVDDFGDDK
jgi:hypothetical protein